MLTVFRALVLALLAVRTAGAADGPRAVLPETAFHFERASSGALVEHEFTIRNEGPGTLEIRKVGMTPPLMVTKLPARIPPGTEAKLRFKLDTTGLQGLYEGTILVSLNDLALPEVSLAFEGEVVPPIELSPMAAVFIAAQRGERKRAAIEIINHEAEPLRIDKVEHGSQRFTTKLETLDEGRRYRLSVTLEGQGPAGQESEAILLHTSSRKRPVLRIAAMTYIRERVYTFPDVVDLGALRLSDIQRSPDLLRQAAQILMVYQSGGTDFRVNVRSDVPALDAQAERGPAGDRYELTLALIQDKVRVGPIKGSLVIETNDPEFPLISVPLSGLIVEN